MDGMLLNDKINNWISVYSESTSDWDSYHINELQGCKIKKSEWIDCAFKIYTLCKEAVARCNMETYVALCFELNITTSHRPIPLMLSRQCFNNTGTHPEIYLFKNKETCSSLLSGALYLQGLTVSYNSKVYLLEKKDDVYWRWLFFVDNDT